MKLYWVFQIAEDLKPNQFLVKTFDKLCKIFPTWKAIAPSEAMDVSVKDPEKRAMVSNKCNKNKITQR